MQSYKKWVIFLKILAIQADAVIMCALNGKFTFLTLSPPLPSRWFFFCASFSFTHFPSNCHFDYHFFYFHLTIYFMLSFVCLLLSFAIHYTVRLNEWREERSIKEKRILVLISLAISFQVSKVLCKLLFGYECDCRFVCLATCIPSSTVCHMLSGTVYF